MVAEQFVPDGPHLKLYNYEKKHWDHLMNWQHATMYLFYGISGLVDIVAHGTNVLPAAMDRMMLSLAVFIEGQFTSPCKDVHGSCGWVLIPGLGISNQPYRMTLWELGVSLPETLQRDHRKLSLAPPYTAQVMILHWRGVH